jgi:hypothetical protein
LRKSSTATTSFMSYLGNLSQLGNEQRGTGLTNSFLFSLQEPWAPKNRISGIGRQVHLYYDRTATRPPRAAALSDAWTSAWTARLDCRQTKIWFPAPNPSISATLVRMDRIEFSKIVQSLTGHNFFRRHMYIIDPDVEAKCRFCQEDDESSWHLIAACPALAYERIQSFGTPSLDSPPQWSPYQLSRFLQGPHMRLLLDWEGVE